MEGNRVVNFGSHPFLREKLPQMVSFRDPNHILMKDVAILILNRRKPDALAAGKALE